MDYYLKEDTMNKCSGCGANLQNKDASLEGYVTKKEATLCERCFRIQNYNDYQKSNKTNNDFFPIMEKISHSNDLVIVVIDLFHTIEFNDIMKNLPNDTILVLTKRDLLPHSLYEEKLITYFSKQFSHVLKTIIISSKNNYHFDLLYETIIKYKKSDEVYVVGYTNAGKSTMINQLIYHYTKLNCKITTSNLPSTTLNFIRIPFSNFTLIDTPGLLTDKSNLDYLCKTELDKVVVKKEIRPRIYQVKQETFFKLNDFIRLNCSCGNIIFYFSNSLTIERVYKMPKDLENFQYYQITVPQNSDIVFPELGFIKITKETDVGLYVDKNISFYVRESYL